MTKKNSQQTAEIPPLLQLLNGGDVEVVELKPQLVQSTRSTQPKKRLTERRVPIKASVELFGQMNREMVRLARYTYDRIDGFPKRHKLFVGIGESIVAKTDECLELIHVVCAYNPRVDKEARLRELSVKLKTVEDYVMIAYYQHHITARNRDAWIRMLTEVDNLAIGIAMWLEKKNQKSAGKMQKEADHCQTAA